MHIKKIVGWVAVVIGIGCGAHGVMSVDFVLIGAGIAIGVIGLLYALPQN